MRRIVGSLQHYPWGHRTAIAELRGVDPTGRPEAEYWLGAHPRGPGRVLIGGGVEGATSADGPTLDAVIAADPDHWLGRSAADRFGELPFLLKLLAVDQPLSIQAHPNVTQARAGFERENLAGIDRDDFKRSYRDPNHKPELICALSPFEAKCGIRPLEDTRRLISRFAHPAIGPLRDRLEIDDDPRIVFPAVASWLLTLDESQTSDLIDAVVSDAARLLRSADTGHETAEFRSELEWTVRLNGFHAGDVGIVFALLLNHLTLEPGQALFLPAGVLHAYLSGLGVELMANSDNVLRGGLTTKHVDIDELLSVATFEPYVPQVQAIAGSPHRFDAPVPEFGLTVYRSCDGEDADEDTAQDGRYPCAVVGPEMVFVETGRATLVAVHDHEPIRLDSGEAVAVPAATGHYELVVEGAETMVWRATVGR